MAGGYILNNNNMPVYVPILPAWEVEVDVHGHPIGRSKRGGGLLGKLIVFAIATALAVIAAVATIFGGTAVFLYLYIFASNPGYKDLKPFTFLSGLKVMYWPLFYCQVNWFVLGLILLVFYKLGMVPAFLDNILDQDNVYQSLIMSFLICLVPAILFANLSLQKRLLFFPSFNGFLGYSLALVLFVVAIVCGFIAMGVALKYAIIHYPEFTDHFLDILPRQFWESKL